MNVRNNYSMAAESAFVKILRSESHFVDFVRSKELKFLENMRTIEDKLSNLRIRSCLDQYSIVLMLIELSSTSRFVSSEHVTNHLQSDYKE